MIRRLHATVYAAVGRAVAKSSFHLIGLGRVRAEELPAISVFGPQRDFERRVRPRTRFLISRREVKGGKAVFKPYREWYENAVVHGKKMPTFAEGRIDAHLAYPGGIAHFEFNQDKLFDVKLTMPEYRGIVKRINERLAAVGGPSMQQLFEEPKRKGKGGLTEEQIEELVCKAYGIPKIRRTPETTPHALYHPFYYEAARVLANKFVKQCLAWVEKNAPED